MWKKIAILALIVVAFKLVYDFLIKKMEEAQARKAAKIPEDQPDAIIDVDVS